MASAETEKRAASCGMTLVEVLVSLLLSSVLLAMAMTFAHTMARVQAEQSQLQTINENMRGAMAQLSLELRAAGAGFSSGIVTNAASPSPASLGAVTMQNGNPDSMDLVLATGTVVATTLQTVQPGDTTILADAVQGSQFAAGDYALLSDYASAVLYHVAGTSNQTVVGVPAVAVQMSGAAPSFPVASYAAGSSLMKAAVVRYALQQGDGTTLPSSWFLVALDGAVLGTAAPPAPLAENIIDLQIAVGIDGLAGLPLDGVLQEVGQAAGDDEWVFNVPGETLPAGPQAIRAIRVSLVGRTSLTGDQPGPGRPAVEDHAAGPPDRYRWRVMTETIMLRNMVLR